MTPSVRLYRTLLRLYPRGIRERFGEDMTLLFADQLRDAAGSPRLVVQLWLRTLVDLALAPDELDSDASDAPKTDGDATPAGIVDGVSWAHIAASRRTARVMLLLGAVATAAGIVVQGAMTVPGPCFGCDDRAEIAGLAWMWRIYRTPTVFPETRWRYRDR